MQPATLSSVPPALMEPTQPLPPASMSLGHIPTPACHRARLTTTSSPQSHPPEILTAPQSARWSIQRLQGAVIGTPGSWNSRGNTIWTVFDDNIRSFYDAANATGDWAGLDFGEGVTNKITQIKFSPRPNNDGKWINGTYVPGSSWGGRMVGGQFQGSNDPTFASGVVTLYTITTAPPSGVMTSVTIVLSGRFPLCALHWPD